MTVHVVKVREGFELPRRTRARQQAHLLETIAVAQAQVRAALAREPQRFLLAGDRTINATGAVLTSPVVWPDGVVGAYTGTASVYDGQTDGYVITWPGPGGTLFYRSPAPTRDATGRVTNRPPLVISTTDGGVTSGYGADAYGSDAYGG